MPLSGTAAHDHHGGYHGSSTSPHVHTDTPMHTLIAGGTEYSSRTHQRTPHVDGDDPTLTFDEYPLDTTITDQYESDGVLFSGDAEDSNVAPYITDDGSSTTNPVLSGGEGFGSDIRGSFVVPGTTTPGTVSSFSFELGYINDPGSTEVQIYGPADQLLGTVVADSTGFFLVTSDYSDASYFVVTGDDPAGWR